MKRLLKIALAILGLIGAPANAQNDYVGEFGGFELSYMGDACAMHRDHEGPGSTQIGVVYFGEDQSYSFQISNYGWSARENEPYIVGLAVDKKVRVFDAYGVKNGARRGFIIYPDDLFIADFEGGDGLYVFLDTTLITKLSLEGTASAMAAIRKCAARVDGQLAAQRAEEERYKDIPRDPFGDKTDK